MELEGRVKKGEGWVTESRFQGSLGPQKRDGSSKGIGWTFRTFLWISLLKLLLIDLRNLRHFEEKLKLKTGNGKVRSGTPLSSTSSSFQF